MQKNSSKQKKKTWWMYLFFGENEAVENAMCNLHLMQKEEKF